MSKRKFLDITHRQVEKPHLPAWKVRLGAANKIVTSLAQSMTPRPPKEFMVKTVTWASIIGILLISFSSLFGVERAQAVSQTWTSTAEFATWTLTNTAASNNALALASSGGSPAVVTKSAAFPSGGTGPTAVWDVDLNLAYIFSGNNDDTNLGIYKYNPATDSLTTFTAVMPFWNQYAAAVWNPTADKAYIFGGNGGGTGNEIVVFDPAANSGGGSITTLALTLPANTYGAGAVWNDTAQKAYIFGGGGGVTGRQTFVFDPNANAGLGSITTHSLLLPATTQYNPAVWDPDNGKAYVFGSWGGNGDEIYVFNPTANAGAGSMSTHALPLPDCNNYMSAVWDDALNKANILGGDGCGPGNEIVIFDPNANSGAGSVATSSLTLPSARNSGAAVWADSNGKSYFFQGWDPNFRSDDIIEYYPGGGYVASGTATKIYTPLIGSTNLWQSATVNTTLGGQTVTVQYTSNPDCTTGLTSTISSLSSSESICIKVTMSTSDPATSPTLNDLTINYATYGQTETKTWTTTADFNAWTKAQTQSLNNSLSLTYTEDVGQVMTQKSFVLPRQYAGSSVVYAANSNKFYLFGGANEVTAGVQTFSSRPDIIEIDPATNSVTKKTAVFPFGLQETSAVWDSINNVAYIFGGVTEIAGTPNTRTLRNAIYRYTPGTDTLSTLTPTLPTARSLTSAVWNTSDNVAYIFGGDSGSGILNTIIQFDPAGGGGVGVITTKSEVLPYQIRDTAAVWNPTNSKAYIFGGYKNGPSHSDEVIEYTPSGGLFRKASDGLPTFATARQSVSAVWNSSNNKAYIMGGGLDNVMFKDIVEFNPAANSGLGSLTTKSATLPHGRYGSSAAYNVNNGLVYTFGGSMNDQIIMYNPTSDAISPLSHLTMGLSEPSAVYAPSQAKTYTFGGRDYIAVGANPEITQAPILEYDLATNTTVSKTVFPGVHYASSAVWNPSANVAYIFGGHAGTTLAANATNKIYKYTPSSNTLVEMTPTLPTAREYSSAVWDPANNVAYIFGGYNTTGNVHYNTIIKFDPAANGGAGGTTTLAATLPVANSNMSAVWNPNTSKAYLFGGGGSLIFVGGSPPVTGNDVVEFNPAANGGAGSATNVLDNVLGFNANGSVAVWSTNRNRAFIIGTSSGGIPGRTIWEYNPVTNSLREPLNPGGHGKMRYTFGDGAAVWNSDTNSAIILGGSGNGILGDGTDGVQYYPMDSISEYYPGRRVYDSPGTGTILFTPSTGTNYVWQSVDDTSTLNGQTVSFQYTTNTNCSTGLTNDLSALGESESLCIKATLATADESVTPTLDDVTLLYGIGIAAATPTPTPSSPPGTPTPTPSSTPSATPTVVATTSPTPTPSPTSTGGNILSTPTPDPDVDPSPTPTPGDESSPSPSSTPTTIGTPQPSPSASPPPTLISPFGPIPPGISLIVALLILLTLGPPLVTWVPHLVTNPLGWWWNVISGRKRKYALSRVVSSSTGLGIPYMRVTLIDPSRYNRVLNRAWTDKEGKFGFMTKAGDYKLIVGGTGYRFPSQITRDGYHGDLFKVGEDQIVQLEVPVDPTRLRSIVWQTFEEWVMKIQLLRIPLLLLGTVLTVINIPHVPLFITVMLLAYYAALWAWELSRTKQPNHLVSIQDQHGKPVPFARIEFDRLYSSEKHYTFVTNDQGKVYVETLKGTYKVTIHLPGQTNTHTETIELKYGVMPRPLTWVLER